MEAFKDEFSDPYVFEQISGMVKDSMSFNIDSHILSNTCQNPALKRHVTKLVMPTLTLFQQMKSNDKDIIDKSTALSWIYVGLLQLHLLLPSSPLDPAQKPLVKSMQLDHRILDLKTKLTLNGWESKLNFCFDVPNPNDALKLKDEINHVVERREKFKKKSVQRPDNVANFVDLYREMHSFANTIGNIDKVLELAKSITSDGEIKKNSLLRSKEQNWQTSACAFCARIYSKFQSYEDIVIPFLNAVRAIQHGLRKLIGMQNNKELLSFQKLLKNVVNTFLHYPNGNLKDISWLSNETYVEKINKALSLFTKKFEDDSNFSIKQPKISNDSFSMQLATMAHLELMGRMQSSSNKVNNICAKQIMKIFFSIVEKWKNSIIEDENELRAKNINSIMESEEEKTEKCYRKLFPDHSREFLEIINQVENK